MQNLIRLSSTFCEDFLHQTMHFADRTCLAVNRFRGFISLNHLNIVNLLHLMNDLESAIIEFEMSKSRRRLSRSEFSWLNWICILIQIFLNDEIKFQQQHVALHAYLLRPRPQHEYVTPSHLIDALNQTSLLDSSSNSSVNRISRFIDHAQILSERIEKWTRDLKRKFYWTIHEEIHLMIFTSRSENDMKTTNRRIEIDIEVLYLVNRKIQIDLDAS
jgi:hypothetical protein